MRYARVASVLLCATFFVPAVEGQDTKPHVTLSLDEFQELFSSARLEEAERRLTDQRKMHEAEHKRKLAELEHKATDAEAKARHQRGQLFPENYQVLHHNASGFYNASASSSGVEKDVASFQLDLTIRIMEPRWTMVPLANTTSTVTSDWEVTWKEHAGGDFSDVDPVDDQDAMLVIRNDQQVLATNKSGLFNIRFVAHTRVGKARNLHAVGLSNLLYPLSQCKLRIAKADKSGLMRKDFSITPKEAVLKVHPSEAQGYTEVHATLPLTSDLFQIKWVDAAVENQSDKSKQDSATDNQTTGSDLRDKEMSLTSFHSVLHRVEEGMVRSFNTLELTGNSGDSISSVDFVVHGRGVRVTSVEGHALQGWSDGPSDQSSRTIRATFKTSQVGAKVTLQVHTEFERKDSVEEQVQLPSIECKNVLRQRGHIAVVKDANVEVHEHKRSGISPCDASELDSKLRLNTDRPIVLSYKYLNPQNSVVLNVTEHVAMETLEATIDRVHYRNVVTDKLSVHSLILILQSTKLQYLEIQGLPDTASMFTVMVNSVSAKPVASGGNGDSSILIPLLVGQNLEAANEGGSMRTSVELNYVSKHEPMGRNGTLDLDPPSFSLPISVYTVDLRLPELYFEYDFSGDFGNASKATLGYYSIPEAFSYTTGKRVVPDEYEFSAVDDYWPEDRKKGAKTEPIKIVTPKTGRSHYFHRLLVLDGISALNVRYSEPAKVESPSWWSRILNW